MQGSKAIKVWQVCGLGDKVMHVHWVQTWHAVLLNN